MKKSFDEKNFNEKTFDVKNIWRQKTFVDLHFFSTFSRFFFVFSNTFPFQCFSTFSIFLSDLFSICLHVFFTFSFFPIFSHRFFQIFFSIFSPAFSICIYVFQVPFFLIFLIISLIWIFTVVENIRWYYNNSGFHPCNTGPCNWDNFQLQLAFYD